VAVSTKYFFGHHNCLYGVRAGGLGLLVSILMFVTPERAKVYRYGM